MLGRGLYRSNRKRKRREGRGLSRSPGTCGFTRPGTRHWHLRFHPTRYQVRGRGRLLQACSPLLFLISWHLRSHPSRYRVRGRGRDSSFKPASVCARSRLHRSTRGRGISRSPGTCGFTRPGTRTWHLRSHPTRYQVWGRRRRSFKRAPPLIFNLPGTCGFTRPGTRSWHLRFHPTRYQASFPDAAVRRPPYRLQAPSGSRGEVWPMPRRASAEWLSHLTLSSPG